VLRRAKVLPRRRAPPIRAPLANMRSSFPLGTSPTGEEVGVLGVGGRTASLKGVSVGQCAIRLHSANLLIDVSVNVVP
jgi:hypothetical protein